ncbi:unnamed protein product [Lactuca saligna]|uniref:Uncharacterized protein n=1 Tax=Lactuca saligna TaxID=75948 RepID=A0AA35YE96_LACSI|nr:unnamed protein product [Lactuca saligna]
MSASSGVCFLLAHSKGFYLVSPFLLLCFAMASSQGLIPSSAEFVTLQEAYGLTLVDGVEFPVSGSLITWPPSGKAGVYLKTFDAGLRLLLIDFQEEIL